MVLIFSSHVFHLIILVGKISFVPYFAIQVLSIDNILGEPILDLNKVNLAIKYFFNFGKM